MCYDTLFYLVCRVVHSVVYLYVSRLYNMLLAYLFA